MGQLIGALIFVAVLAFAVGEIVNALRNHRGE